MNKLLFFLINCSFCIFLVSTDYDHHPPEYEAVEEDFSSHFFFFSDDTSFYYVPSGAMNYVRMQASGSNAAKALDYHIATRTLYWTSPGIKYRNGHPLILPGFFEMKWDYEAVCNYDYDTFFICSYYTLPAIYSHPSFRVLRIADWNPRSLAVDNVGNKLYVVDTDEWSINVFDLNGQNKAKIFESEYLIPFEVALDSSEGLLFLFAANTQTGTSQILRMNMDGTMVELIVNNTEVLEEYRSQVKLGFTVDIPKKRIYFGNFEDGKIEVVDYLGQGRRTVVNIPEPRSISIYKDNLYYYHDIDTDDENFLKVCSPIQTCKLDEQGVCIVGTNETMPCFGRVFEKTENLIKIISPRNQSQISNPCDSNNGGCQHHCLLKSPSNISSNVLSYGCVCNAGYYLLPNLKNCTQEKTLTVYDQALVSKDKYFKDMWDLPSTDDIFPISIKLLTRLIFNKADSVYTGTRDNFFKYNDVIEENELLSSDENADDDIENEPDDDDQKYEDKNDQKQKNVSNKDPEETVFNSSSTKLTPVVAYDWITRNNYYVESSGDDKLVNLMVLKRNEHDTENYDSFKPSLRMFLTQMDPPVFMTMHPYRGFLFAVLQNNSILRLNSDGTNKVLLPNINNSSALAIDFNDDKLYWSNVGGAIWLSDLDGSNAKQLLKLDWTDINKRLENIYMYVFGEYIYIKSYSYNRIWRYHKINGTMLGDLEINDKSFDQERIGIKVTIKDAQCCGDFDHPCAIKNGGCKSVCFGVPKENVNETELTKHCI